jgi:hypothetical protein
MRSVFVIVIIGSCLFSGCSGDTTPDFSHLYKEVEKIAETESALYQQEVLFRFSLADGIAHYCLPTPREDGFPDTSVWYDLPLPKITNQVKRFRVRKLCILPEHAIRLITTQHGVYETRDHGQSWTQLHPDVPPPQVIYPFEEPFLTKPILSYQLTQDKQHALLVTSSAIYMSSDGGYTFELCPMEGKASFEEYICGAIHPTNPAEILIGTAYNGFYYSTTSGMTIHKIRAGVPGEPVTHPNFLEQVAAVGFDEVDPDIFYAGFAFGNGYYRGSVNDKQITPLSLPVYKTYPDGDLFMNSQLGITKDWLLVGNNRRLYQVYALNETEPDPYTLGMLHLFLQDDRYDYFWNRPEKQIVEFIPTKPLVREYPVDERVHGVRSMYISWAFTLGDNYPKLIKLLQTLNFNSVVINMKDDYGQLRLPTDDPMITQVPDAVEPYRDILNIIKRLHEDGIYVIGRLVVFKDKRLYAFQNGKYAVKNKLTGHPLHKGPEKWVDAFSEFVWDYNIAIAKVLEQAGVDEIQFDYIRFPDVRGRDLRRYDFKRPHQTKRETLVSFLKKAREEISVPISVDLFGYNSIYTWGNWIGQNITLLSEYVDVVSPMFYPSHYTGGYAMGYGEHGFGTDPEKRIYYTISLSCKRAKELAAGALIRPYLQGFYYRDNSDQYCVDYIGWELDGLKSAGLTDYIFWNDLVEYTILIKGIRKYYAIDGGVTTSEHLHDFPKKLPWDQMIE